jgi:hypothetical protein
MDKILKYGPMMSLGFIKRSGGAGGGKTQKSYNTIKKHIIHYVDIFFLNHFYLLHNIKIKNYVVNIILLRWRT